MGLNCFYLAFRYATQVERHHRVLKDHGDVTTAQYILAGETSQVLSLEDLPSTMRGLINSPGLKTR